MFIPLKPIKCALCLALLLLVGCEEEKPTTPTLMPETQELATQLHQLPPKPEPVLAPAPKVIKKPTAAEQAQQAQRQAHQAGLALRQRLYLSTLKTTSSPEADESETTKALDYSLYESPQDKSTLPLVRDRLLTAEMRISAILEDAINSQVPGRVIALVDSNILSPTGKYILIPAYSKVICHYASLSKEGETRLPLVCSRLIRPDGVSIHLTPAQAADQMGRTGVIGRVDNRVFQKYGGAFLVSVVSALSQTGVNQNNTVGVQNAASALANNLGEVTAKLLESSIDIRPVIHIPAGARIQIVPEVDILLRHPQDKPVKKALPGKAP
ncbi:MAG: hypothetical protein RLZ35_320 [Pseudomonadota bacterium]